MLCRSDRSSLRRMSLRFKTKNCKTSTISKNDFLVPIAFYRKLLKHPLRRIVNSWANAASNSFKRRHLVFEGFYCFVSVGKSQSKLPKTFTYSPTEALKAAKQHLAHKINQRDDFRSEIERTTQDELLQLFYRKVKEFGFHKLCKRREKKTGTFRISSHPNPVC